MASIDELSIEINAKATKVNTAIDNLVGKLDMLTTSLGKLDGNGSKLATLANGVQRLGTAMQTMNSVKTADFTRLAKNLSNLNNLDTSKLSNVAVNVNRMGAAFKNLSGLSEGAKQLNDLAAGIKQLGYTSSTKAIENIPKLATAMKKLMAELNKAPRVSQNLIDMTNALAKLSRTGASSGRAANSIAKSLNTYTVSTHRASKGSFSLASAIGKVYASYWLLFRAFGSIRKAIDISSSLTEVQNVVDVTFGNMSNKVEEFAKTSIQQLGMSELSVKTFASRFQAMGTVMKIDPSLIGNANKYLNGMTGGYVKLSDSMSDVSLNLTKLTADMASFYNVSQEDVAKDLESIFTGETRPLRQYGLDLTQATLQEWAMKQGLDANVQSMSQAEKTMLRYQYVLANSGAAQKDFIRTQGTWANQVRILRQQLEQLASVIGGVFINALKPLVKALNVAMSHIIEFATTISNALGKIFGWKFEVGGGGIAQDFESAAGSAEDIAGSTGQAANNIKKMKAGIRAFDELKVINMPEKGEASGGAGGAGGAGAGGGTSGGQWVQVESILDGFESEIDTLYKLGDHINKALTKAMNSINWEKIYQSARNFGSGLASFLNGLISPDLFKATGETIAGALNTAIQSALSFGITFEFDEFGLSIAEGINGFFTTFDFAGLAKTINVWVQGIWDTVKTAIVNIDWKSVWGGVKEFFSNIKLDTVAIIIGAVAIKKILGFHLTKEALLFIGSSISRKISMAIASKLGSEIAGNKGIGTALSMGLSKVFDSISGLGILDIGTVLGAGTLAEKIIYISKMLLGVGTFIGGLVTAVKNFFDMWNNGFNLANEALMVLGTGLAAIGAIVLGAPAAIAAIVAGVVAAVGTIVVVIHDNWDAICKWFSKSGEWFNKNVITPIAEFFQGLWKNVSEYFSNLWKDIVSVWTNVSSWFGENVIEPVVGFFQGLWKRVKKIFEGLWIIVKAVWMVAYKWFKETVIDPIVKGFKILWEKASGYFKELWKGIKNIFSVAYSWFKETVVNPIVNIFNSLKEKVKIYFSELWVGIKNVWGKASNWFSEKVINPVKKAFKNVCKSIGGFFNSLWSGIKETSAKAFNSVISGIEGGINGVIKGINLLLKGFNKIVSGAAKITGSDWTGVELIHEVSLPKIKGYSVGGFPEKASLFWANENGVPELVGTVGGKTAVGPGVEITGISDTIRSTSAEEISLLRQQNQILQAILQKEYGITKDEIGRAARSYAKDYANRTGKQAYSF